MQHLRQDGRLGAWVVLVRNPGAGPRPRAGRVLGRVPHRGRPAPRDLGGSPLRPGGYDDAIDALLTARATATTLTRRTMMIRALSLIHLAAIALMVAYPWLMIIAAAQIMLSLAVVLVVTATRQIRRYRLPPSIPVARARRRRRT